MTSCIRYRISTGRTRKDTKVQITPLVTFSRFSNLKTCNIQSSVIKTLLSRCGSRIFLEGHQLPRSMRQTFILQRNCQKLHENERIWTEGACIPGTPLDPSLIFHKRLDTWRTLHTLQEEHSVLTAS